ncbi:MAG: serine phosphatase RsbU (regulator of sigma subunit) [Myxococcota bacterium]|jgi:serine phosphatase RsbU (regulator of sigma subunit)
MKLWQKYGLALFLAAAVPVGVAAWQIAGSGAEQITQSTKEYHLAIADVALARVNSITGSAQGEARSVAAAMAPSSATVPERERAATALLVGAVQLENFAVYSPAGDLMMNIWGADETGTRALKVPAKLDPAMKLLADTQNEAFGDVFKSEGGTLMLPLALRILKEDGETWAYGWSAVDLSQLSKDMAQLSSRRFREENDHILVVDKALRTIASADPAALWQPQGGKGALANFKDGSAFIRGANTVKFADAAGDERMGVVAGVPEQQWLVVIDDSTEEVYQSVGQVWNKAILIGGLFAALALLLGLFLGKRLSAPIVSVSKAAGTVAGGNFDVQVPVPGKDEVGQLAMAFNAMTNKLNSTIEELKVTTATKERMQTELDIGHNIQMSMVPQEFPAFPERPEFDVHAALEPAYEVGGDFYDFFLTDEDTLCVVVADVSGKGVPAALFMAVTRTMVQAHASGGKTPDDIIGRVNDELARDNDECMFVTVFLGLLDIKTGLLRFTNAGHNPSYVKRTDGSIERLDELHGPVVAAIEEVPYGSAETILKPGDGLFLYTDGVNEAMNAACDLYTEDRLANLLRETKWSDVESNVKVVLDDVWDFQGDAEQSDDVTIVALTYNGTKA